jgi:hypothetical protein
MGLIIPESMKRLILLLVSVVASAAVLAQVPVKMSYQAVIRDVSNVLVSNQTIGIKVSILHHPLLRNPDPNYKCQWFDEH